MATNKASLALVALFLAACGESTTENITQQINQTGMDVVESVKDLPKCTKDNEGEVAWVKGENSSRVCVDGKWFATKDTLVVAGDTVYMDGGDFSCTTKELKDKSGIKIICNGDSIGVVLNGAAGKDGDPGKDGEPGVQGEPGEAGTAGTDGTGCSLAQEGTKLTITCGEKSATIEMGEGGGIVVDTTTLDSEMVAISLDEVSGVTQKGPFLMGSKVEVHEIADGRSLKQTGNSFKGKIMNDKGEFSVNARMLVSQYVALEAVGYYRNEVTGENSNSELTLFAITDVTDRNIVNVNLLTHLEYDRVNYLVTEKKMKVRDAKKQAQREIFALLDIDATGFSNSEDLNIAGASDEDGALLAFSLMFQGDRSVANLSALLQTISNDIKTDGKWDDPTTRMQIAEWSADADSAGRLATIRENVARWQLSTRVPNFEQFVRHFWSTEYGLDSCNKAGVVKGATAGKRKGTNTRYICKEDGAGVLRWQIASDFEKDTYQWENSTDGALKSGDVTGKKYVFDETGSLNGTAGWRLAVAVENLYGGCREALYDSIRSYRGQNEAGYYLCQESTHKWAITNNNLLIDTQGWSEGDDGFSKWGDSIGVVSVTPGNRICYVYDTSAAYRGWREGNNNDCTLGIMGCTAGRAGRMLEASNGNFYNCANNIWTEVVERVQFNTNGWNCLDSNDGEMRFGQHDTGVYFICDSHSWREATTKEEDGCRIDGKCIACTQHRQGDFHTFNEEEYVCDSREWRTPNCAEAKLHSLCTANDSAVVWECETMGKIKVDYVCSKDPDNGKLVWHPVKDPFEYTLDAWLERRENYFTSENLPHAVFDEDLVDERDGHVYKTVVVAGMTWMAENLNFADTVNYVTLKGHVSCHKNQEKNCSVGGRRYTWSAVMNIDFKWDNTDASSMITRPYHQGICPDGWHVPNKSEWKIVMGVETNDALAKGFRNWSSATDSTGLALLPVGTYDTDRVYYAGTYQPPEDPWRAVLVYWRWDDHIPYDNHEGPTLHLRCVKNPTE